MESRTAARRFGGLPPRRPEVVITPSAAKPFAVDCREVPGWFCAAEAGERCVWGIYDPPDWKLTSWVDLSVVRPARVHDVDGVEIAAVSTDLETGKGWVTSDLVMFSRLTPKTVEWLAVVQTRGGTRVVETFLDDGFDARWGERPRIIEDRGRLAARRDGLFTLRKVRGDAVRTVIGAGLFRVRIGPRTFTCLRVLDIEHPGKLSERSILSEAYLTRSGRTVFWRRYNGRLWKIGPKSPYGVRPWDERLPDAPRLVINGTTFVHWYDCLTNLSVGQRG